MYTYDAKRSQGADQRREFQYSQCRAQCWEFVVEIADAALARLAFSCYKC